MPPAQRKPSPKTAPAPPLRRVVPWKNVTIEFETLVAASTIESLDTLGRPFVASCEPDGANELGQPRPLSPIPPQGHAVPVPSPKQNGRGSRHAGTSRAIELAGMPPA